MEDCRLIRTKQRHEGGHRFKEFLCYGRKNIDKVCSKCNLRFECFSSKDPILLFIDDKDNYEDINAIELTQFILDIKFKVAKDKQGRLKTMVNYGGKNVRSHNKT
jgi:hypothetical protein